MSERFLNPYNFVPAFPRHGLPEDLRDAPPPGQDRLPADPHRWTGRIGVTLTVETPLLLLDTARSAPQDRENNPGHLIYPVRLRNGRPHLAQTAVKGMLRSAFEMITSSRMGVFVGHGERLGFRHSAEVAQRVTPVALTKNRMVVPLEEAKLLAYPVSGQPVTYADGSLPRHRDAVVAIIKKDRVLRLARRENAGTLPEAHDGEQQVTGWLYITGRNIKGKKYERLFYKTEDTKPHQLDEARWQDLVEQWELLIRNYRDAHSEAEIVHRPRPGGGEAHATEWLGDEPGRTAWSPHLHEYLYGEDRHLPLCTPLLCWARYEEGQIVALYPVKISRDVYGTAPRQLLDDSLLPAPAFDRLSPAERVFGWVAPEGSGRRPAAYRGRVRIGPVTCDRDATTAVRAFPGDGMPLAVLGEPKPQQGGFYLSESRTEPDKPIAKVTPRPNLYKEQQALRGRKTYPHHAALPAGYWDETEGNGDPTQVALEGRYREFLRPWKRPTGSRARAGEEQRDTQNRSIRGWVEPKTTFRFTIEVRDLDEVELGALAWLLTLPGDHFHRLGLGKPLGFGSVRLAVDPENTELSSGDQWVAYYCSLTGSLPTANAEQTLKAAVASFTAIVESSHELITVRKAFLAAAHGNPRLPVHYPRVRHADQPANTSTPPDPDGNVYAWFTENQRSGRGRSLPRMDPGAPQLEIYDTENDEKNKAKEKRQRSNRRGNPQPKKHRAANPRGPRRRS